MGTGLIMKLSRFTYTICMILLTWQTASAQPGPKAIEYWTQFDAGSNAIVDHSAWDSFLGKYIKSDATGLNLVDYGGVTSADKEALVAYLDLLQATNVTSLNRKEQEAYWINAYNAITVNLIIDKFPVDSIRDVSTGLGSLFNLGPWDTKIFTVEDQELTLNDIEHGILHPIWKDPRIHYSVNCASYGCPNLMDKAWTSENIEELLDEGARTFVNSDRGIQNISGNRVKVSSIYHWYKEDFGGTDEGVIEHLKIYAAGEKAQLLKSVTRVNDHDYDWKLNTVK